MAGGKGGGQGGRGSKSGSHRKGAPGGSGGHGRRRLEGKGPTPPAEARKGHPASRRAAAAARRTPARGTGRSRSATSEVVAGRNAVVEALRAQVPATSLYVAERIDLDERVRESITLAGQLGVPLLEAPRGELDRMVPAAVHQGVALLVPAYSYLHQGDLLNRALEGPTPALVVALDGVTDPRNLGAVVRSAAAFGAHGVLVPERRSAGMTAGAWKASAGAAARLPVARATNLARALAEYADAGLVVVGLAADGEVSLEDLEVAADPLVLVIGSEGRGLSRLVGERCALRVRIPIGGGSESLNAGVAAGIALYEVDRRRRGP